MDNNLDEKASTINDLMSYMNKYLNCDTDCQREREIESLRKKWKDSKSLLKSLPEKVDNNEKNFYVAKKGLAYYQENILRARYLEYIKNWREKQVEQFFEIRKLMKLMLKNLIVQSNSKSKLNQLYEELLEKNKTLEINIDNFNKNAFTNGRRAWYQTQDNEETLYWRFFIKIFYFAVIIAYIIFGGFIRESEFKNWKTWLFLIFYCIFPFILHYIISLIIYYYNEINNQAPG